MHDEDPVGCPAHVHLNRVRTERDRRFEGGRGVFGRLT
jgi:hypothetical protein